MELRFDPDREHLHGTTGIYVRAQVPRTGRWDNADIAELDTESLFEWLRSRGGSNPWAENVVFILLGHPTEGGPAYVKSTESYSGEQP